MARFRQTNSGETCQRTLQPPPLPVQPEHGAFLHFETDRLGGACHQQRGQRAEVRLVTHHGHGMAEIAKFFRDLVDSVSRPRPETRPEPRASGAVAPARRRFRGPGAADCARFPPPRRPRLPAKAAPRNGFACGPWGSAAGPHRFHRRGRGHGGSGRCALTVDSARLTAGAGLRQAAECDNGVRKRRSERRGWLRFHIVQKKFKR